jgi:hypothetical protein
MIKIVADDRIGWMAARGAPDRSMSFSTPKASKAADPSHSRRRETGAASA